MRIQSKFIYLLSTVGIVGFYLSSKFRQTDSPVDEVSKKLRSSARHLVSAGSDNAAIVDRQPATQGAFVGNESPRDRFVRNLFASRSGANVRPFSLKNEKIRAANRERLYALKLWRESGSPIADDGIGALPKLRALPRQAGDDENSMLAKATVLNSSWAIFNGNQLPDGKPVVYDFNRDQWGVMTGMVEVSVDDVHHYEDAVAGIRSRGYDVVRLPNSKETVYVVTKLNSVAQIEKVSQDLKEVTGASSVKPETIFVWRGAQ